MENTTEEVIKIEVRKNGPLVVHGELMVTHVDGSIASRSRIKTFFRCGASSNKPYCDGKA